MQLLIKTKSGWLVCSKHSKNLKVYATSYFQNHFSFQMSTGKTIHKVLHGNAAIHEMFAKNEKEVHKQNIKFLFCVYTTQ